MVGLKLSRVALAASTAIAATLAMTTVAQAQTAPVAPAPAPTPTPQPATTASRPVAAYSDNLTPQWGNIRSFWGDNTPFWGNIRSFWGDTGPYADDLTPFWGNIRSFNDTNTDSALLPSWGNIRSFAGDIGASWGNIRSFWGNIRSFQDAPQDYVQLSGMISTMVGQSQTTWGTAVQAQTGQSFADGFANPLLAKYGIDLNNPASLQNLSPDAREHFFMDWWDGLMNFSGADHVDHWMNEVHWSPTLTQTLGAGSKTVIGVLDFSITGEAANNVVKYGGVSTVANGHGAAVASLMVDPMDGKGVMGIAPRASVISYNPFDATQTAGWSDITNGVANLTKNGATIINMSLGVPGWTLNGGWDKVFQDPSVNKNAAKQVFVVAAGNDGVSQTQNITWHDNNPQLIIVGSVDPTGTISSFSNQPGTACFGDDKGNCGKGAVYLKDRFIVAPGEMILVSDGLGGTTRLSGTSFAAPLVSGTIALIQDRWPWLTAHPKDTVNIILNSARDLGAPGVDPVYGHGELDVLAALSPLDWSKLTIKQVVGSKIIDVKLPQLQGASAATQATWELTGTYFSLFENTGESFRDFEVPVSSRLANQTVSIGGSQTQFMNYLTSRFTSWISTGGTSSPGAPPPPPRFTDLRGSSQTYRGFAGAETTLTMRARANQLGFRQSEVPFDTSMRLASPDARFAAEFGNGQSAPAVAGLAGFAMTSDYDPQAGGVNPFLGLASGGAYSRVEVALAPGVRVATGITQRELRRDYTGLSLESRAFLGTARPYRAQAVNTSVMLQATPRLTTTVAYTLLHEDDAVLGMAPIVSGELSRGSSTDAATVGADWAVTRTVGLSGSATVGRTRAGNSGGEALAIGAGGLMSSSFQVAVTKAKLLSGNDRLRLTLAQPMHVERGSVDLSNVEVIDRSTGELGLVTHSAAIASPARRYVAEMLYGRSMLDGRGSVSLFGRATMNAQPSDQTAGLMGGTSLQLAF